MTPEPKEQSGVTGKSEFPSRPIEVTVLMPCLNEAETLASCVRKARLGLEQAGVEGEVLIADNGSTDGSVIIAEQLGARVISVKERGYGSALRGGIEAARGKWVIMGDADDSYDFSKLEGFVEKLRQGYDLVMGNRMPSGGGVILPGAMPWKNRWIGNPVLSLIGRLFFKCPARDFHCGLRGFTREAAKKMELKTAGMEFASEMVIKATLRGLRIAEVPITLHRDGRSHPPHLKPWRDGWRHLRFMLIYSPRWLFLVPGLVLALIGLVSGAALAVRPLRVAGVALDAGSLAVAGLLVIIGGQLVAFAFFTKVFAIGEGLLPQDARFARAFHYFSLEKGIVLGLLLLVVGVGLLGYAIWVWKQAGFGMLPFGENLRRLIPAVTLVALGIQVIFSSFFLSILGLRTASRQPPAT
jgi:hypothetical protein